MDDATRMFTMLMTAEEFLVYPLDTKAELVRGELRMIPPPGGQHGRVATNVVQLLSFFTKPRGIGMVFADGVGYELRPLPHTVRVPDASFVRAGRIPAAGIGPGFLPFAPDIAVEVLSPSDAASDLDEKVDDYLVSGTSLVWIIDPVRRSVTVIAADAPQRTLRENDTMSGGNVLPEFSCKVAEIFEGITAAR